MSIDYIVYCRKSSQGDTKQVASIDDQKRILEELESREKLSVIGRLEESKSAKRPYDRPIYRSLIERLKSGEANGILCWNLNRLVRNPMEDGELRWLLQEGVIQRIKTPEREYRPEDHALLMAVESSMANQYVRDLKNDVERGVREKALKGWYPYRPKVGYMVDPLSGELLPDPTRFALIKRMWALMFLGTHSVPQILKELNSWGYRSQRTKNGGDKPMNRSSLYRLLTDRFYTGWFTFDGSLCQGRHEPMISVSDFEKVQRMLGRSHAKHEKHFHPYAGFIRCGVCGCMITAETHVKTYKTTGNSQTYTYYHCTGRKGCRKESVPQSFIDSVLLRKLEGCRLSPKFVAWALRTLDREETTLQSGRQLVGSTKSQAIAALTKRLDRLFVMREDGEITGEEFKSRRSRYTKDLQALQFEIERDRQRPLREIQATREALVFRLDAHDRFRAEGYEGRRSVARAFAREYVLTLGKLSVTENPGMEKLRTFEPPKNRNQQVGPGDSGTHRLTWRAMLAEIRKSVTSCND